MRAVAEFIKKKKEEYKRQNPPDFVTHSNYVNCLNGLSKNLSLRCNLNIRNRIQESKVLSQKITLLKLTLRSINTEHKTILKYPDYAAVCVPWISVKAYYLIFNLLLILDYLLTGQELRFNSSHERLFRRFKDYLEKRELVFNKKIFTACFRCSRTMNLQVKPGANIKMIDVNLSERYVQILKILIRYKLEDFQRKEKIKNFMSKKNRQKRKEFLDNNTVNICEFFYWYRIKANYRDLEFLNKDISSEQFSDFYHSYFELTFNFCKTFGKLINNLSKTRLGKEVLQLCLKS